MAAPASAKVASFPHAAILGMRVDCTTYAEAAERILQWAQAYAQNPAAPGRFVCMANVHMVMEAFDSAEFRAVVNRADLVTSDGMPLVWGLQKLGFPQATRVYGPDLTLALLDAAQRHRTPIGFYGGSPEALQRFQQRLAKDWPDVPVACAISPPFRPLTPQEDEAYTQAIRNSGARLLFVGLGCPKQERWMAAHQARLPAVLLGVGAAFDFLTGAKPQAPRWMMRFGLEWLFRFVSEPARLWRRYLILNPRFVMHFSKQLLSDPAPRTAGS